MTEATPKRPRSPEYKDRHAAAQRARYLKSRGGQYTTTKCSVLQALVQDKAATPQGYITGDAGQEKKYAGKIVSGLLKAGVLHKLNLSRQVRYFATADAALAYQLEFKPAKAKRFRAITAKGQAVRALIAKLSQTPAGFRAIDAGDGKVVAWKVCADGVKAGGLYPVKISGKQLRFFSTPELAASFAQGSAVYAKPERAASRAPASRSKPALNQMVLRSQNTAPHPKASTPPETVYPAHYLKTVREWHDPRAVSVPMVRIGSPGWSMSVGGAA